MMSQDGGGCCSPRHPGTAPARPASPPVAAGTGRHGIAQCSIPAGTFTMGDSHGDGLRPDGETPVHAVSLDAFTIDATTVTNADFARFADQTGYRTESEIFGFSAVFHLFVAADDDDVPGRSPAAPWWVSVPGADWRHPGGPRSALAGREDHPVVHVVLERRPGVLPVGRPAPAHRSRMGIRFARRPGRGPLPVGRRPARRRRHLAGQHLAGHVPGQQHRRRRMAGHRAGADLPA